MVRMPRKREEKAEKVKTAIKGRDKVDGVKRYLWEETDKSQFK